MRTLVLSLIILAGCSGTPTIEDQVREKLEAKLQEGMNDPSSYEFVSLEVVDTITYGDNAAFRLVYWGTLQDIAESTLETEKLNKQLADLKGYGTHDVEGAQEKLDLYTEILFKVADLKDNLGETANKVASYTLKFKFRGKNAMNATVLNEYIVQTGPPPALELITVTSDKDELKEGPGDFPGYREMVGQYMGN